jgi:hypothetical protein
MRRAVAVIVALVVAAVPATAIVQLDAPAPALLNPVATDEVAYQAYGRVWSDPHGCLREVAAQTGRVVSPWAKGNACAIDMLSFEEVVEGATFLARRFPDQLEVIRLDERYDNPDYVSAGIARAIANEGGDTRALGRDKRPLYLFKVTDRGSDIPEEDRDHFVYALSIHGLERQGVEGGVRAMEDLVTWAACEDERHVDSTPACATEGPFPKPIIESETDRPVPTAGETLRRSVVYFMLPNPDGWAVGQRRAAEVRNGGVNTNYHPGAVFTRGNGHGVDLNRDWPTAGYTLRSHQPLSEPETRAFADVLSGIKERTSAGAFAAGIDLHGMLDAYAFSYTLIGAGQRDYRKNAITVETSLRTWEDQTARLAWSPWVADDTANGEPDGPCFQGTGGGTRGHVPSCVADEWGTVFDTLGYTITGGLGDWMDSPIGLDGVGINNEMALSAAWEPSLVQTHIDGNKGLIYSNIAALLYEEESVYEPTGRVGYLRNPQRIQVPAGPREPNPGLPAQPDLDVLLPCQAAVAQHLPGACAPGEFGSDGAAWTYEFDVLGALEGFWNGGMTVTSTTIDQGAGGVHLHAGVVLQRHDEAKGGWVDEKTLSRTSTTLNDPVPGRWRIRFSPIPSSPRRVSIAFDPHTAEAHPGQAAIDASSMDFFDDLNRFVPEGSELQAVDIEEILDDPAMLAELDSLVVVNELGSREHLVEELGLSEDDAGALFAALGGYAEGGGNLVLTDAALQALPELGVVPAETVQRDSGIVGFYSFEVDGTLTYTDPDRWPLAAQLDLPGAAEGVRGRRQAVEPTPLGFNPDASGSHRRMPFWGVDRGAWEEACGKADAADCTVATTRPGGSMVNLGEAHLGDGVVRIAGAMLPDPSYVEDELSDTRFGLASYALTYTAYLVFENLVDHQRP